MRITEININKIKFEEKEISAALFDSIQRIGLSFPVKLKVLENGYVCIDGNKRIKVLKILGKEKVNAIIMNNGNARSNDCWRDRNYH